jgi:hypothetical protein
MPVILDSVCTDAETNPFGSHWSDSAFNRCFGTCGSGTRHEAATYGQLTNAPADDAEARRRPPRLVERESDLPSLRFRVSLLVEKPVREERGRASLESAATCATTARHANQQLDVVDVGK